MKKPLISQYNDKIAYSYTVTGVPRIRAEWNWNETAKLSDPYEHGIFMNLIKYQARDDNNILLTPASVEGPYPPPLNIQFNMNKNTFDRVFEQPISRRLVFPSPSFTDLTKNRPDFTYEADNGQEVHVTDYFGLEMFYQFEATEDGAYQFYSTSDDSYETYITDDDGVEHLLFSFYGIRGVKAPPLFDEQAMTPVLTKGNKYRIRVRWYNGYYSYGLHTYYRTPSMIAASNPNKIYIDESVAILPDERGVKENPEPFTPDPSDVSVKEWQPFKDNFPLSSVLDGHRPISGIRYNMLQTEPDNNPYLPGSPTFGQSEDLYPDAYAMLPAQYITTHNETYKYGNNRGDWIAGEAYSFTTDPGTGIAHRDIVTYNDRDYACISPHTAGTLIDFTKFKLISVKPTRYYNLHKFDQKYKYWVSETKSATSISSGSYPIDDGGFIVHYDEPVSSNKVSITFNLGPKPVNISVDYWGWLAEEDTEAVPAAWHTIFGAGDIAQINPYTGELQFWHRGNEWTQHPTTDIDNSVKLKKLRVQVQSLNRPKSRLEVIEASARKELDISDRVAQFDIDRTLDEQDFMRLIGEVSANSGSIVLSNWDNAFELDEGTDQQKLEQVKSRRTKFTFDIVYDLEGTDYAPRYYPVRVATMYSADWSRDGEYDFTVNLFDSAKLLMNLDSTEFFEKAGFIHTIIAQLCDSVGFDRYQFDRYDYDAILNSTVLDFYAPTTEDSVWQALQKVARATLCAIFFDEYDQLQIMTKEEITNAEFQDTPELTQFTGRMVPRSDYVLRGQFDESLESPYDTDPDHDTSALPNIASFEKSYDQEANKVKITYKERYIKGTGDPRIAGTGFTPGNSEPQTDIVWKPEGDVTVRATRLVKPLPNTSVYSNPDNPSMYFYITGGDTANLWPYKGKANISGEIIEWEGKLYKWMDPVGNGSYIYREEVIYSEEDRRKRDAKTATGTYKLTNAFTGGLRFKVDAEKRKVTGRAIDYSKYSVDHPTDIRPGWQNVTTTLGNNGVFPGNWPGLAGCIYPITSNTNTTSIEFNRPKNSGDDWFRTQALMRRAGAPLQQWGFRFKFKESATMGEVSLIFNLNTAAGGAFGSQVASDLVPATYNQFYQVSFLETNGIVRDVAHEIAAWVQSPDPLYRQHDNAIRGSASRMYNRNYWESWAERMKGYRYEFKRDVWYDVKVDLTRGRGYSPNHDMHFFVWINGVPAGGFAASGPPDRHLWLPTSRNWMIGFRAASKVEIENAYSWTEFGGKVSPSTGQLEGVQFEEEQTRQDLVNGGYNSSFLEEGLLYPAKGASAPYRDGSTMSGEFFFDDFGSVVHEIREFEVDLDKAPAEGLSWFISNENVRMLDIEYSPNRAKFSIVNVTNTDQIAAGEQNIGQNNNVTQQMVLYGYVLTEGEEADITRENTRSIRDRGEIKLDIAADWINTKHQAEDLADWVVDHFSQPMDVVNVEVFGDASYSIGDKVRVFYEKAGINKDWLYIISRIKFSYEENGLVSNITIRRVRNNETNGVVID